ncbi:MAG: DUF3526 domain-containing protein [Pseudomonadota bacterium]
MIGRVARLDLTNWRRDRRLGALLFVVVVALIAVTAWAVNVDFVQREAQMAASESARTQWEGQGDANPHGMAHFGDFAFRPAGPMAQLDRGVQARVGKVLFMEGHRQGVPLHTDAARAGSVARFPRLDAAFLLQTIVPLVLIFLGATSLAADRESGRLKLALVQGAGARSVLSGHFFGLFGLSLVLLLLVVATSLLMSGLLGIDGVLAKDRLALFLLVHVVFFAVVSAGVTATTVWLPSARGALVTLLSVWVIATALLPRATAGIAGSFYSLPTQDAFQATLREAREAGPDGHNPEDAELDRLRQEMLDTHGVETVEELPFNFDGIAMQVDEEFANGVWDTHYGELRETMTAQVAFGNRVGLLNPFQSIKRLSMALAGTDLAHDVAFQQKAESHRRELVAALNHEHAYGGSKTGDWSWEAPAAFFAGMPQFQYSPPSLERTLSRSIAPILSLLFWALLLTLALRAGADRLERGQLPC